MYKRQAEDRNMNTLVDMISGMEVKEDDEDFMNAVDYMLSLIHIFDGRYTDVFDCYNTNLCAISNFF